MPVVDDGGATPAPPQCKVLMLNETDESGGAARAAVRLAAGLRRGGMDLRMAVQRKDSDRHWIDSGSGKTHKILSRAMGHIDLLPNVIYPGRNRAYDWSNNWFPNDAAQVYQFGRYDLLHFHWMGRGFLPMRSLAKLDLPIVWTLHDMWNFTGGCHYSAECAHFEKACGMCPRLDSRNPNDLSARNLRAKRRAYAKKDMHIVSPSNWLAELARKSSLLGDFEISVIPYGLDLQTYRPLDRRSARESLGLPQGARIVLFGAINATRDHRKGFPLLCSAITKLTASNAATKDIQLVVFGSSEPDTSPELGIPVRFMGKLSDDVSLACLYSAADVMVLPSRQENLANAAIEAMACGTPVVAFDIGGNSDLIDHLENGYLAAPFETDDLAAGISWVLSDSTRLAALSQAVRKKCEQKYDLDIVCGQYEGLYRKAMSSRQRA